MYLLDLGLQSMCPAGQTFLPSTIFAPPQDCRQSQRKRANLRSIDSMSGMSISRGRDRLEVRLLVSETCGKS